MLGCGTVNNANTFVPRDTAATFPSAAAITTTGKNKTHQTTFSPNVFARTRFPVDTKISTTSNDGSTCHVNNHNNNSSNASKRIETTDGIIQQGGDSLPTEDFSVELIFSSQIKGTTADEPLDSYDRKDENDDDSISSENTATSETTITDDTTAADRTTRSGIFCRRSLSATPIGLTFFAGCNLATVISSNMNEGLLTFFDGLAPTSTFLGGILGFVRMEQRFDLIDDRFDGMDHRFEGIEDQLEMVGKGYAKKIRFFRQASSWRERREVMLTLSEITASLPD